MGPELSQRTARLTAFALSQSYLLVTIKEMMKQLTRFSVCMCLILTAYEFGRTQNPELVVRTGHTTYIGSIAFDPKGKIFASGSSDRTIKLWDVETGKELRTLTGHTSAVFSVAFSADGKTLASGDADGPIKLWNVATGTELRTFSGHTDSVHAVTFSADGKTLASVSDDATVKLWDIATSANKTLRGPHVYGPRLTAFSPDGKTLISGDYLFDIVTGVERRLLTGHTSFIHSVSFSHDGKTYASGNSDNSVKIWDAKTGNEQRTLIGHTAPVKLVRFSADGKSLMSGSGTAEMSIWDIVTTIKFWDVETGKELRTLEGYNWPINSIAYRPDGKTFMCGSWDGSIKMWDIETGKELNPHKRHTSWILSVTFGVGGKLLASGNADNAIKLWDVTNGAVLRTLRGHDASVNSVAFSKDGRVLASGSSDRTIKLWDVKTGKELRTLTGHDWFVDAVAFSPDGKTLASGTSETDGTIKLWNVATGTELKSFSRNERTRMAEVMKVVPDFYRKSEVVDGMRNWIVSSYGRWQAKVAENGKINLVESVTGKIRASLIAVGDDDWLVVTPDGLFDGTADAMGQVGWRVGSSLEVVPLDTFFNDFFHPGLLAEIFRGGTPKANTDIAMALQFPALRTMLKQRLAHLDQRDGRAVVCFQDEPTTLNISLLSNGQPVSVAGFDFIPTDSTCRYRKALPEGATQVQLVNALGEQRRSVEVSSAGIRKSETKNSTLHVLTVAVKDYPAASGVRPLPFSISGAKAVEDFFTAQGATADKPFADVRVSRLYNGEATRAAIRGRLTALAGEVKPEDVVFLFISGHGVVPAGQEMFYFVPADGRTGGLEEYRDTGINTAMLAEALRNLPARRLVLVIDACQSGGAVESLAKIGGVKAKSDLNAADGENAADQLPTGVVIIASAAPLQYAQQIPSLGNGALVTALLEALQTQEPAGDEKIWVSEVVTRIKQRTPEISRNASGGSAPLVQTPLIEMTGADFPIAAKRLGPSTDTR